MKKLIVALAVSVLTLLSASALRAQMPAVPALTSAQYASMDKNDIFVIMFTVPGCVPCAKAKKMLLPSLVEKYAQDDNVHVFTFLVNDEKDSTAPGQEHLYKELGISRGPTFVVLHEGVEKFKEEGFSEAKTASLKQNLITAVSREK